MLPAAFLAAFAAAAPLGTPTRRSRTIEATLSSKQEPDPTTKGAARATGRFSATGTFTCPSGEKRCDTVPGRLGWTLVFGRLTGRAQLAHIHLGRAGSIGPVAIALCAPCRSGAHGTIFVGRRVWEAIAAGRAYVNVHTDANPLGEIRGQLRLRTR